MALRVGRSSLVFTVTDDAGADGPAAAARGRAIVAALQASPYARQVISYWTVPLPLNAPLAGADHRTGLVSAQIVGDDSTGPARADALASRFVGVTGDVTVRAGRSTLALHEG